MRIAEVKVTPIAFRDPPLLNAAGIHEPYALRSIIEVHTECGRTGLGESYGDAAALSAFQAVAPALAGLDPFDLNGLTRLCAEAVAALPPPAPGAELAPGSDPARQLANCVSAFEVALLDLQAQHAGLPLHALLGGAVRRAVPFSAYLFFKYARHIEPEEAPDEWGEAVTPEQIVAQARRMIELYGFGSIKLKAGTLPPDLEVASIEALARAFPGLPLRIDPNGAWSMETAIRCAERLGPLIEYYEDPVDGLEAMGELHRRTGLPLATNMVVTAFEHFPKSIALNSVQIVLSDHHYWGGLRASQNLGAMCRTFGLGLSMHSNSHLGISLMAMSHLAAATPNLTYACDTHYPWVEEADEVIAGGKVPIAGGCVTLGDAPGLGVTLDPERLARGHATYNRIAIRTRDDLGQMRKYDPAFASAKPRY
ncbi:glucarate dehydratase family protein [Novosphingobium sp.]|uniref:glucarate dehydratase family protein n=1 Tax=Novosphingobium sp. TaxID=1874826 RepID=UPI0035AE3ED1